MDRYKIKPNQRQSLQNHDMLEMELPSLVLVFYIFYHTFGVLAVPNNLSLPDNNIFNFFWLKLPEMSQNMKKCNKNF